MKGKLTRDQVLLFGGLALLVAMAGGLGWYGLGELTAGLERAQALVDRKGSGDLASVLNRPGGLGAARKDTEEMLKFSQDLGKREEAVIGPWYRGWEEASGQGADWSKDPGPWKDKLVRDNDEVLKKCSQAKDASTVTLGENFYLGLEEFKQKSPSNEQVPRLARQLSVAKKLVDLLILAKTVREGYATPCVLLGLEVPSGSEAPNPEAGKSSKGAEDKNAEFIRERYRLRISCSPEVLYEYVRLLSQDDWLFVITNLSLANEREIFPKRGEIAKLFQVETPANPMPQDREAPRGGEKETGKAKLLLVLSGKERVNVNLEVDFIGWKNFAFAEKIQGGKK